MSKSSTRKSNRRTTLADVGREAGVSNVAASAVLNGSKTSSRVSKESRERILTAARKLNYSPNIAARALVHQRMNVIGVAMVLDSHELNHYFMEVFNGILEEASDRNQNTTVFTLKNWDDGVSNFSGYCDGRIDGMILVAPVITELSIINLPTHTPFVALHSNKNSEHILNIESDEEKGSYEMVKELTTLGHKRIMHVGVCPSLLGGYRRANGYKRALVEAGITYDPDLHLESTYERVAGRAVLANWLKTNSGNKLPQAIFCANDAIAIGCMEALSECGIRIPEQVSICGFDDTLVARTTIPQLSTVRQPLRKMGHRAVTALLDLIDNNLISKTNLNESTEIFVTELILRKSTQPPQSSPTIIP